MVFVDFRFGIEELCCIARSGVVERGLIGSKEDDGGMTRVESRLCD